MLLEEEFVMNQERLKPQEEKDKEERSRVDELRGSPMNVGTLEEIIDDDHAIVKPCAFDSRFRNRVALKPTFPSSLLLIRICWSLDVPSCSIIKHWLLLVYCRMMWIRWYLS